MKRKNVTISLPADVYDQMVEQAEKEGVPKASLVKKALAEYFEDHQPTVERRCDEGRE